MATITVRPSRIQPGMHVLQKLFCTLAAANWTTDTTFAISGASGVTKVSQNVVSPTQAYVVITTTTAPKKSTQTLTVSDGTNGGTTSITPIAPARGHWF